MSAITLIPNTWTTIGAPTAAREIWQCLEGQVEITAAASPQPGDQGMRLNALMWLDVSVGATVSYRRFGDTPAVIAREAI